jgi:hypothetical protein
MIRTFNHTPIRHVDKAWLEFIQQVVHPQKIRMDRTQRCKPLRIQRHPLGLESSGWRLVGRRCAPWMCAVDVGCIAPHIIPTRGLNL